MVNSWRVLGALAALAAAAALLIVAALFQILVVSDPSVVPPSSLPTVERDLDLILGDGVLRVSLAPDEINYYVRQGRIEGLGYEMARSFANRLNVELEIVVPETHARSLRDLGEGLADLVAFSSPGARPILTDVAWSEGFEIAHPVVVGRKAGAIGGIEDLRDRVVAVRRQSMLEERARAWREQLAGRLRVVGLSSDLSDQQIALLAASMEQPLVLLDHRRARLEAAVYETLELSAPLGPALPFRWALRPSSTQLREELKRWMDEEIHTGRLSVLQQSYFENPLRLKSRRRPTFRSGGPILSPYDALFQREAVRFGLDWRLLTALAFAESGYDRWEISSQGAMGLLQIMPVIARKFGALDPFDPAQNVAAGAAQLNWLYELLDEVPEPDRLRFTLAAYNMGLGHLQDARALAAMRGFNPDRWDEGVARVLPLMEDPAIAEQLLHGQARGSVTLTYVNHVTELFEQFAGENNSRNVESTLSNPEDPEEAPTSVAPTTAHP